MIYSDRFKVQHRRGFTITPLCILHNVQMPDKIKVLQESETGPGKYETTIELVGETVTGKGKYVPVRPLLLFFTFFSPKVRIEERRNRMRADWRS